MSGMRRPTRSPKFGDGITSCTSELSGLKDGTDMRRSCQKNRLKAKIGSSQTKRSDPGRTARAAPRNATTRYATTRYFAVDGVVAGRDPLLPMPPELPE